MMQITEYEVGPLCKGDLIYFRDLYSQMYYLEIDYIPTNWISINTKCPIKYIDTEDNRYYECTFITSLIHLEILVLNFEYMSINGLHVQCSKHYSKMYINNEFQLDIEDQMENIII